MGKITLKSVSTERGLGYCSTGTKLYDDVSSLIPAYLLLPLLLAIIFRLNLIIRHVTEPVY